MRFALCLFVVLVLICSCRLNAQTGDPAVDTALEILRVDGVARRSAEVKAVDSIQFAAEGATKSHCAFVRKDRQGRNVDGVIYISSKNHVYSLALQGSGLHQIILAGCIIHEEEHLRGGDEIEALTAEKSFLERMFNRVEHTTLARQLFIEMVERGGALAREKIKAGS